MIDVALVSENKALYNKNCYIDPGENPCFLLFGDYSGCERREAAITRPLSSWKIVGAISLGRTKKKKISGTEKTFV